MISLVTPQFPVAQRAPALFLDRDDTLMVNHPYLSDPAKVKLFPGAVEGLSAFRSAGFRLIVVSNQSGLARGYFSREQLLGVTNRLIEVLAQGGVSLDAIYYCPHSPEENCECRKPRTGLLQAACRDFAIDLSQSLMVGDKKADMEFGNAAQITAVQFLPNNESKLFPGAAFAVHSLVECFEKYAINNC